jgi:hypothetical protein
MSNSMLDFGAKSKLVIGIDFGTTFTGVAYYYYRRGEAKTNASLPPEQICEKIAVVQSWPNALHHYSDKTATALAYKDGKVIGWGGNVKPSHSVVVRHFKLGLQPGSNEHYRPDANEPPALDGYWSDANWKHPSLAFKEPVDLATDYLKEIRTYILEDILPKRFGQNFLAELPLKYVLTVPAIWSDKARSLTKTAAVGAGIPENDLDLITEPEAAALYCSTLCDEMELGEGDRFLVCDAGGGTVVRVQLGKEKITLQDLISYEMVTRRPFKVKEVTVGTGSLCGAISLNENFKKLLRERLGVSSGEILTPKCLEAAIQNFEGDLKRNFDPFSPDCDEEFEVSLPGARDNPSLSIAAGFITLPKYSMSIVRTNLGKTSDFAEGFYADIQPSMEFGASADPGG